MLLVLATSGLVLAGCGGGGKKPVESSEESSSETTSSRTSTPSEDTSAGTSEESEEGTSVESESSDDLNPTTYYFREAPWWNAPANGKLLIALDGEEDVSKMHDCGNPIGTIKYGDEYVNDYSFDISVVSGSETFRFVRAGLNDGVLSYWGAKTAEIDTDILGSLNLYSLVDVEKPASWSDVEGGSDEVMGVWADYDDPEYYTPKTPDPVSVDTIYFRDEAWWAADEAYTAIYAWNDQGALGDAFPGTMMTCTAEAPSSTGGNVWSIPASQIDGATGFIFVRVSSAGADWGAKSVNLAPSDISSTSNLYDITGSSAVWGDPGVSGSWTAYAEA